MMINRRIIKDVKGTMLSPNYRFDQTPGVVSRLTCLYI